MSMSFGGGDPYAALVQALMQRRQAQAQQQPQQQMPQMGGTMQSQPGQMPAMGGGGQSAMSGAMGGMPSASSMAEMLKRMQAGSGKSDWAMAPDGNKVPVVDAIRPADQAAPAPGMWSRFSSMFGG